MKTEIQERKCSGWHLLSVKLCSQACHWKWMCGQVKLGWHFQCSGYFWELFHHSWPPTSLSSFFPVYITVLFLFLLAMNYSLFFKFSGDVCSVSFICHQVLASLIWMWPYFWGPVTLRVLCDGFWRWSLLRLVGKVGSGHSKIANNSPLRTVLSAKEAKFRILRRWKP